MVRRTGFGTPGQRAADTRKHCAADRYEAAFELANRCIREGDWDLLWTVYQEAVESADSLQYADDDALSRLYWAADHPGETYPNPVARAKRRWDHIVTELEKMPAVAERIAAERAETERKSAEALAEYERERQTLAAESRAARERIEAETAAENARMEQADAEYLAKLPSDVDSGKLGARWVKIVVNRRRPDHPNGVAAITRRPYPVSQWQHILAPHLQDQLYDLAELGENWNADNRSLGWLFEKFTEGGGKDHVFWRVLASVVSVLGGDDEPDDEDDEPVEMTPERQALLDSLNYDNDARAAVRQVIRDGKLPDHRAISEAAAGLCGAPAETVRNVVKAMSRDRQIVKVDPAGKPLENISKRGYYILADK